MSSVLPTKPSLVQLKKQAKDLLKAHQGGDVVCCAVLRNLRRFQGKAGSAILASAVSLSEVQFAIAMEYGFASWAEMKRQLGPADSDPLDADVEVATPERFSRASVKKKGRKTWLEPIPRYPWAIRRRDESGAQVRFESEPTWRILGNLYCAMRMMGHDVTWDQVAAASGDAFRFAFEPNWAQDAEYVTDVDHFALACENLGFEYVSIAHQNLCASLEVINGAIEDGMPALTNGWGSRFGRVVVGLEADSHVYRCIGGDTFGGEGPEPADALADERVSPHFERDDCYAITIPLRDWYGAVLTPEQAGRNLLFIVGKQASSPGAKSVRRVLELALQMNAPRTVDRVHFECRRKAIETGDPGHDGWKFYYSPWEGKFTMGSEGIRAWADVVEDMKEPSMDFEMIHGFDTTFQLQLGKMHAAARYMRWASTQTNAQAAPHLREAGRLFREAARVSPGLLRWRYRDKPAPSIGPTRDELIRMIEEDPALVHLITGKEKELLGEKAEKAGWCPWGFVLVPEPDVFQEAKIRGSSNLRKIAQLRDQAFAEIVKALAMM